MVSGYARAPSPARRIAPLVRVVSAGDDVPLVLAAKTFLRMPFDAMREQYASAVRAGVIERSLLASASFERKLGVLERTMLGPWARRA